LKCQIKIQWTILKCVLCHFSDLDWISQRCPWLIRCLIRKPVRWPISYRLSFRLPKRPQVPAGTRQQACLRSMIRTVRRNGSYARPERPWTMNPAVTGIKWN